MAEVLVSPGIQITETDRSYVPARPLVAGAAIIGPTVKGPVNAPTVVSSYREYQSLFGTTFMMNRYKENYQEIVAAAKEEKAAELVPYSRSEGEPEVKYEVVEERPLDNEKVYYIKDEDTEEYVEYPKNQETGEYDEPAEGVVIYEKIETPTYVYTAVERDDEGIFQMEEGQTYYSKKVTKTFDPEACTETEEVEYNEIEWTDAASYTAEVDEKIEALDDADEVWEGAMVQQKSQEFLTSMAAKSFFEQGGESLLVVRVADNEFRPGRAQIKNTNGDVAFEIKTISEGEYLNNWEGEPQDRTATTASIPGVIRTDGSLISGSKNNIRWEVADVDEETGTFSIYVRRGDDIDSDKAILEIFSGLTLDPDDENYIARRIGDQYQVLQEDTTDSGIVHYVTVMGNYPNRSRYIYVQNVNDIYGYFLADGFTRRGSSADETADPGEGCTYPDDVAKQLPIVCEGGFQDAEGKLFTTHEDEANAKFFEDIKNGLGPNTKIQGIAPERYDDLIAVLENTDEYEINMISVPGLVSSNNLAQVAAVDSLASYRGDLIAVVDLVGFGTRVDEAAAQATRLNSSYSATYWPWLQMYSSTGRLEWVPASVIIPGVYSYNDRVAAPWFAPAGVTRGSVQGVVQPERKLLKQHRDTLYKKNVNPISILPGNGITIYGQKTLQKRASALDRVNVRRLMIELKRTVKNMAAGILFEQNTQQLRNMFKANLDQYLESVTKRRGLYAYKTIVEELNGPDVIDRNEFRAQIYVQPTRAIEFIYIDFTITNTGVEFNN